jgi:hypothetical protein
VGVLILLLSILFMVTIFLLCYTWAQFFLGNLNNLAIAPAASSSSRPDTSAVDQIILDPATLQSIIFQMKLHEVGLIIKTAPELYVPVFRSRIKL